MRVAVGTDEVTVVTEAVERHVVDAGHQLVAVGRGDPWPAVGRGVAEAVADGRADRGIVWCWTGTGVSIAANKVHGVRAALCPDPETARGARKWNDANVLAMGLRLTSEPIAVEIVDAFLSTEPDGSETDNIAALEAPNPPEVFPAPEVFRRPVRDGKPPAR
jgi:ribose 5-phosphate isomerase B